jgi:Skp family chaperone for outer membrane proteins
MRLFLCLVLCACTTGSFAGDAGTPATPAHGPDYAVLRLDEVIRTSKQYLARLEQLKKDKAEAEAQLKQLEEQGQTLNGKLEVLSPSSEKYAQAQEEREMVKVKTELLTKRTRALLDRRHGALLKESYDILRGHLATFAKERHIHLVTLAPNPDLPNGGSNDILMQLGMQTALYYDPALDITADFISYVNGRFAAEAPAGPTGPAGAAGPAAPRTGP